MPGVRGTVWVATAVVVFVAGLWVGIGTAGDDGAAKGISMSAALDARREVPKPKGVPANARRSFVATLERKGTSGTLAWRLTFRGLSGKATAAHVHLGKPGRSGPVTVALCGSCRSGVRGSSEASARTVRALLAGGAYVNVHTARNPAGEIRGQIQKSSGPSPTTTTTTTTTTGGDDDPYP